MDLNEAEAWLRGERSSVNWLDAPDAQVADAALTQQAYWVVKANKEGLVAPPVESEETL